jgi:hypothetical protein
MVREFGGDPAVWDVTGILRRARVPQLETALRNLAILTQ